MISIDNFHKFLKLSEQQANIFSNDENRKVCALFIEPISLHIISSGVNSFPVGIKETKTKWGKPQKYRYVCHAELNAIYNACKNGISLNNSICVVNFHPCSECAKGLIQCGIRELYTYSPDFNHNTYGEDFMYAVEMLKDAEIDVYYY